MATARRQPYAAGVGIRSSIRIRFACPERYHRGGSGVKHRCRIGSKRPRTRWLPAAQPGLLMAVCPYPYEPAEQPKLALAYELG